MEKYCKSCGRVFKKSDFKICPYCGNQLSTRTGRQPIPRQLRHQVFQRDGYRCRECGASKDETSLEIDHIVPVAKGGTNDIDNLQTLCRECNRMKHTDEWVGGETDLEVAENELNILENQLKEAENNLKYAADEEDILDCKFLIKKLKTILGKYKAQSGRISFGEGVRTGYYDQIQTGMDSEKTVFQELSDSFPAMTNTEIRSTLARFLFKNDDVFKELSTLSGGERARVLLTKLMLGRANFLLLDEPTNHLDINSCEALESALKEYEGTLLIVSHDRYLINALADRIFYLSADGIQVYEGSYEDYLKKAEPFRKKPVAADAEPKQEKQVDYKKKKELDAQRRKAKARLGRLEKEISDAEERLSELNEMLNSPEVSSDYEKLLKTTDEITQTESALEVMYGEWEELSELTQE